MVIYVYNAGPLNFDKHKTTKYDTNGLDKSGPTYDIDGDFWLLNHKIHPMETTGIHIITSKII